MGREDQGRVGSPCVGTSSPGNSSQVPLRDQFGRLRIKVSQALLVRWLRTKKHEAEQTVHQQAARKRQSQWSFVPSHRHHCCQHLSHIVQVLNLPSEVSHTLSHFLCRGYGEGILCVYMCLCCKCTLGVCVSVCVCVCVCVCVSMCV